MNFWDKLMGTDDGAASYMETYGEGPGSDTRKLLSEFINDGETVLDIGCGPGWNYDHFMEYGPAIAGYKGMDYSKRFVRVANKRNPGKYEYGDARDPQEVNNSWDVVILQDVLEHTNGYERPVTEALRIARERVIVTFWKPFRQPGDGDQINDDGNDGYGSNYEQKPWEDFLNSTEYFWTDVETKPGANRWHKFYIIDKKENYE